MRRGLFPIGIAVVCGALLLAACADDDDVGSAATTRSASAATAIDATTTADGASSTTAGPTTTRAGAAGATTTGTVDDVGDVPAALRDALTSGGDFSNFLTALRLVGFDSVASSEQVTVFAPTDEAFRALDASVLAKVLADRDKAELLLRNHVVDRQISSSELATMPSVTTEAGAALVVQRSADTILVGGARVTKADVSAGRATVHVVDKVLLPQELVGP
jgi:uncharacterized surface protein with fasciclin (FAS1) repeats